MSTVTETDLKQYEGKKVVVVRKLAEPNEQGEGAVELECRVEVVNELGMLVKPKGKLQFDLIGADEVEDIYLAKETSGKLKASKLQPVVIGKARKHMLERHGVTLEWANSVTEEQAFEYHQGLDHAAADLGHIHVDKNASSESDEDGDSEE